MCVVVGVGEVGDGVCVLRICIGRLLFIRIAAVSKLAGVEACVCFQFDFCLPEVLEVIPCLLVVGAFMPLFVLVGKEACLPDDTDRGVH